MRPFQSGSRVKLIDHPWARMYCRYGHRVAKDKFKYFNYQFPQRSLRSKVITTFADLIAQKCKCKSCKELGICLLYSFTGTSHSKFEHTLDYFL